MEIIFGFVCYYIGLFIRKLFFFYRKDISFESLKQSYPIFTSLIGLSFLFFIIVFFVIQDDTKKGLPSKAFFNKMEQSFLFAANYPKTDSTLIEFNRTPNCLKLIQQLSGNHFQIINYSDSPIENIQDSILFYETLQKDTLRRKRIVINEAVLASPIKNYRSLKLELYETFVHHKAYFKINFCPYSKQAPEQMGRFGVYSTFKVGYFFYDE